MAEGGSGCPCNGAKKKSGVFKLLRLKKKKKPVCTDPTTCIKCLQKNINLNTSQYSMDAEKDRMMVAEAKRKEPNYVHLPPERKQILYSGDMADEPPLLSPLNTDRRLVAASSSRDLGGAMGGAMGCATNEAELMQMPLKYHPQNCSCAPCKKKRYDDSLLAMDAQVILQNSLLQNTLSDTAGLVCVIL